MNSETWPTAITRVEPNKVLLRGYRIDELMGNISFSEAIFLAFANRLPSKTETQMIEAILVSSVDHGATPPSCQAARTVAMTGSPLNAAVAAGVLAISTHHGGAIENCMRMLTETVERWKPSGETLEKFAEGIIREYRENNKRLPGFGHRFHTLDPRTVKLFAIATNLDAAGDHIQMASALEKAMERVSGKKLPVNVDGAIAAALCDLGMPPELGNAFFMIARLPGLVAHVWEEKTRMRPMRRYNPYQYEYDGPEERSLEGSRT
jgi:citrate synthase